MSSTRASRFDFLHGGSGRGRAAEFSWRWSGFVVPLFVIIHLGLSRWITVRRGGGGEAAGWLGLPLLTRIFNEP